MSELVTKFYGDGDVSADELKLALETNTSLLFNVEDDGDTFYFSCAVLRGSPSGDYAYIKVFKEKGELWLFYNLATNPYLIAHLVIVIEKLGFSYNKPIPKSISRLAIPWEKLSWFNKIRYSTRIYRKIG